MCFLPYCVAAALGLGGPGAGPPPAPADGVYAVRRDGATERDVRPLKPGEVLIVHRHRYLRGGTAEPPRYFVTHAEPDVALDLARPPEADRERGEVVRIRVKLRPKAAAALERLTRPGGARQLAIVLGGEVVTVHKVRSAIANGEAQITSCTPGAAEYLLKQLRAHRRGG